MLKTLISKLRLKRFALTAIANQVQVERDITPFQFSRKRNKFEHPFLLLDQSPDVADTQSITLPALRENLTDLLESQGVHTVRDVGRTLRGDATLLDDLTMYCLTHADGRINKEMVVFQ